MTQDIALATDRVFREPFVADQPGRAVFDRRLGRFLHDCHGGWDVSALTDLLDVVADRVGRGELRLTPLPNGELDVGVRFRLGPPRSGPGSP